MPIYKQPACAAESGTIRWGLRERVVCPSGKQNAAWRTISGAKGLAPFGRNARALSAKAHGLNGETDDLKRQHRADALCALRRRCASDNAHRLSFAFAQVIQFLQYAVAPVERQFLVDIVAQVGVALHEDKADALDFRVDDVIIALTDLLIEYGFDEDVGECPVKRRKHRGVDLAGYQRFQRGAVVGIGDDLRFGILDAGVVYLNRCRHIIQQVQPDEIYNLAAQSHVKVSFDVPEYTAETDAVGTLRMLEAVRILGMEKKTKIYQASTSELFGKVQEVPQRETTPFYPRSPYGVAKQYGFWITKNYRESYGMFAVNGILFNHESERRGETFVTRKITLAASRIAKGLQNKLYLGNLDAQRDWGYAKDYVECMWLILQHPTPEDFVIATGEMHTVREFCTLAFRESGIELRWEGKGVDEKGIDTRTGQTLVEVDSKYFRPAEVEQLLGDPTKAKTLLGWNPRQTSFEELVRIMVAHDLKFVEKQ